MKIFISYARENLRTADSLSARLAADKHTTFFDVTSLPAGEGYDARIRQAIADSDLFIFLISPRSVRADSYAMTELGLARTRWPDPSGRVLPVMLEPTEMALVPPYLSATTVLVPSGNAEAAILAAVAKISTDRQELVAQAERVNTARQKRRRLYWISGTVGALVVAASLYAFISVPRVDAACHLTAELHRDDATTIAQALVLDVRYAESTNSYLVSEASTAIDVGPFEKNQLLWKIGLRGPDGSELGEATLKGCISSEQGVRIGDVFNLIVRPRE